MERNFVETIPAPVKYALHKIGFLENVLKPPLTTASEPARVKIDNVLKELELIS